MRDGSLVDTIQLDDGDIWTHLAELDSKPCGFIKLEAYDSNF